MLHCCIQTTVGGSGRRTEDGEVQEEHTEDDTEEEKVQVKGRAEGEDEGDEEGGWNDMELEHGEGEPGSNTELEEEEEENHQTCDLGQVDQSWSHTFPLVIHASMV